jgi:hypothetical protein
MFSVSLLLYLIVNVYTGYKISRSELLDSRRKIMNIGISLLLPVIWYYLIQPVIFRKSHIITKAERERMLRIESGSRVDSSSGTD